MVKRSGGLMTRAEYSKHRGCGIATVKRAVAAGLIPVTRPGQSGRILVEEADAKWAPGDAKSPPGRSRRRAPKTSGVASSLSALLDEDDEEEDENIGWTWEERLLRTTAREREWKEKMRKLEYEEKRRELIPRAEVEADGSELGAKLRAMLLALGSRLGGALSCSCRDPGEVQRLIDAEVHAALVAIQESDWTRVPDVDVLISVAAALLRADGLAETIRAAVAAAQSEEEPDEANRE